MKLTEAKLKKLINEVLEEGMKGTSWTLDGVDKVISGETSDLHGSEFVDDAPLNVKD